MSQDSITTQKVASSVSWHILNRICTFGMNFVIEIVLARLVAPEDFGNLAILNAIVGFAYIFVDSGVSTALVRKKKLDGSDIFTAQIISIGTAAIFCIGLVLLSKPIASYYKANELVNPLRVVSIVLIFNSINSVFSSLLIREMEFKKLFLRTVIVLPLSGAIGIGMAYRELGIWALVFYKISQAGLNSIVYFAFSKEKITPTFSIKKAKEMYTFGIKILFTGIVNSVYDTIRTLVIGGMYSKADLAYYDRAYTYSRYTVQIANSTISTVALPVFSRKQDVIDDLKNSSRKIVSFSVFFMFPLLTLLACLSRPIILVLLTNKWENCIVFFTLFCILRFPGIVTAIDMQTFYAIGRSDIVLKYSILNLLINIVSLLFVLPYGVLAIAVNTVVVEYIVSIIIAIISSHTIGYTVMEKIQDLWRPTIGCIAIIALETIFASIINIKNIYFQLVSQLVLAIVTYYFVEKILKDKNLRLSRQIMLEFIKKVREK